MSSLLLSFISRKNLLLDFLKSTYSRSAPSFFGDVLFEFLSFVAVVVTDVNELHVYPNDNIVSYSKG